MNRQEVFDKVAKHLMEQGEPSMSADGELCAYRGTDGRMCAIGVLIDDKFYSEDLESHGIQNVGVLEAVQASLRPPPIDVGDRALLANLQNAHDSLSGLGNWKMRVREALREVAERYNLDATVLK